MEETKKNEVLQKLSVVIKKIPYAKAQNHHLVRPYWNCINVIYEIDGILFEGERVIIPQSMQQYVWNILTKESACLIKHTNTSIKKNKLCPWSRYIQIYNILSITYSELIWKLLLNKSCYNINHFKVGIPSLLIFGFWFILACIFSVLHRMFEVELSQRGSRTQTGTLKGPNMGGVIFEIFTKVYFIYQNYYGKTRAVTLNN